MRSRSDPGTQCRKLARGRDMRLTAVSWSYGPPSRLSEAQALCLRPLVRLARGEQVRGLLLFEIGRRPVTSPHMAEEMRSEPCEAEGMIGIVDWTWLGFRRLSGRARSERHDPLPRRASEGTKAW
jgi:hypothetical protein